VKVTVSHSGKQHAYRHALSLQQLGRLDRFITSMYYRRDQFPDRLVRLVPRIDRGLQKRWQRGLDARKVVRRPMFEVPEIWERSVRKNRKASEQAMFRRDAGFDHWVARKYASQNDIFWGFQGSCLESLRAARLAEKVAVCEFATAHVTAAKRILQQEADLHPEWAGTISNFHFPDWYQARLEQEPHAADVCIAASGFTRDSLLEAGVAEERIRMLPLGCDVEQFAFAPRKQDGMLKVLFVGGIGQRKGIKYLLEAIRRVNSNNVRLQLLGPLPADAKPLKEWSGWFEYLGQADQQGVVTQMQQADVMVLPSVFEGFGLVIVEAMATGIPVIASTHSCGPEVIREGVDGFVLEPADVDGLANRIAWFAEHRDQIPQMGAAAHKRAQEFSWSAHAIRLSEVLKAIDRTTGSSSPDSSLVPLSFQLNHK
jgi:glycosyltransferase involved in cell wall biosynthesis